MVNKEVLITPKINEGLLPGITREVIMELASTLGFKILERRITISDLKKADEVFLTNSIVELRGVVEIDGIKISKGKVGSVTKLLHNFYRELVKKKLKI